MRTRALWHVIVFCPALLAVAAAVISALQAAQMMPTLAEIISMNTDMAHTLLEQSPVTLEPRYQSRWATEFRREPSSSSKILRTSSLTLSVLMQGIVMDSTPAHNYQVYFSLPTMLECMHHLQTLYPPSALFAICSNSCPAQACPQQLLGLCVVNS